MFRITECARSVQEDQGLLYFNNTRFGSVLSVPFGPNRVLQPNTVKEYLDSHGPLSIIIDAIALGPIVGKAFPGGTSLDTSPVYDGALPSSQERVLDHAVVLVGYGVSTPLSVLTDRNGKQYMKQSIPYWIIRNSWGPYWGAEGYVKVAEPNLFTPGVDSSVNNGSGPLNMFLAGMWTQDIN